MLKLLNAIIICSCTAISCTAIAFYPIMASADAPSSGALNPTLPRQPILSSSENSAIPVTVDSTASDDLICYMETTNGQILNLNQICGRNAINGTGSRTGIDVRNSSSANLGNIGNNGCYLLDANGRPCS
jgi:hypothetical protein